MVLQLMDAEDIARGKYNMAKTILKSEMFLSFYITYYCIVLAHSFSTVHISHIIICVLLHPPSSYFPFTALKETCTIPMVHLRHTE